MWLFIVLYIVGLNNCLANGNSGKLSPAKSYQMYYIKLRVDKNVRENVTAIIKTFVSNSSVHFEDIKDTTVCQRFSTKTECNCKRHYRWSDDVCQSNPECCDSPNCTFSKNASHTCVSENEVTIKGSMTIRGTSYLGCLEVKNTARYETCNRNLTQELRRVYSTLKGFDTLKITKYSVGSVVAHFEMAVAHHNDTKQIINKSKDLTRVLNATFVLEIKGVVRMDMPENPVMYKSQHPINCKLSNVNSAPKWQLKQQSQLYEITNGTESEITGTGTGSSQLHLLKITERWAGEISCIYEIMEESGGAYYSASGVLDVSLMPSIHITTDPQFPHCKKNHDTLKVRGECTVVQDNENYNVTWSDQAIAEIPPPVSLGGSLVYKVWTVIDCRSSARNLTCMFMNRRGQQTNATITINIIQVGENFCDEEGDWGKTKSGFTATLKCNNAEGKRLKKCRSTTSVWEQEESQCVDFQVHGMHSRAMVVDSGIGNLEDNTAKVMSELSNVTNQTMTIHTFPNMNLSVQVLAVLSDRVREVHNESTVDHLVYSSSNMMEKSLEGLWKGKNSSANLTLAEIYLSSFEQLIKVANITKAKKMSNVEVAWCRNIQDGKCSNTAFDAEVKFYGKEAGNVKTAGFKQLDEYLPNSDERFEANSIVVSTTTDNTYSSVEVEIDFSLFRKRTRNVEVKCVWWDNTTRQWSTVGCELKSVSQSARCVCSHLSSFAILMAKEPIEIPGLTKVTTAALSVSVISLILSLAIELSVWTLVVKSSTLYLRHTAHINISLSLLIADCCFLASSKPRELSEALCRIFVVLKHFCYLSMFFWMLCLSTTLIHQAVFLFHEVSKGTYLKFSLVLGYVCPFLIVFITVLCNSAGTEGMYFSWDTCWLIYDGLFRGTMFTFIIPVGVIVFVNVMSMLVVILKLIDHPVSTGASDEKRNQAVKTIMRTVVLLTPIFGITWLLGFGVTILDLTSGPIAHAVNYAFVVLNGFQGLFIFLTTCLGDKMVREALLIRLKLQKRDSNTVSSTNTNSKEKN